MQMGRETRWLCSGLSHRSISGRHNSNKLSLLFAIISAKSFSSIVLPMTVLWLLCPKRLRRRHHTHVALKLQTPSAIQRQSSCSSLCNSHKGLTMQHSIYYPNYQCWHEAAFTNVFQCYFQAITSSEDSGHISSFFLSLCQTAGFST